MTAQDLTPAELAEVQRFGLDKPEPFMQLEGQLNEDLYGLYRLPTRGVVGCYESAAKVINEAVADALAAVPAPTDPRDVAHIECDCVPNLGPSHCHLCGDRAGHPIPWTEAHPTEAGRVTIAVHSRKSGKTQQMIDRLLSTATERGIRVELVEPAPKAQDGEAREALGRIIWETSRADESTISATGANIVADAILTAGYRLPEPTVAVDWEYRCKLRSTDQTFEHPWVSVDADHHCGGVRQRRVKAGPWLPVSPEGGE